MKKFYRVILIILAFALLVGSAFTMTACKGKVLLQNLSFEDGVLSWDKDSIVDSASNAYNVVVNGAKKVVSLSDDGKRYIVNLADDMRNGKDFKVSVEAKGDKVKIDQTIKFRYLEPATVEVKNGVFDWSESAAKYASNGSLSYDVILDGERKEPTIESTYKVTTGVPHTIVVRPRVYNSDDFFYSDWSVLVTASVLTTPKVSNVSWTVDRKQDGTVNTAKALIKWTSPVDTKNVQYLVKINGKELTLDKAELDTSTVEGLDVKSGFSINLQAKSVNGASFDSALSETENYVSLGAVKNLKLDDGVIYFDPVEGAARYCVNINGEKHYTDTNMYALDDAMAVNSVKVCAVPADGYNYFEEYGEESLSFTLLDHPGIYYDSKAFFFYGGAPIDLVESYQIRIEKEEKVNGETVYTEIAKYKQDPTNKIFSLYGFDDAGLYDVSVKAIAKSGKGKSNSLYSDRYQVVRLDTIAGLTIEQVPSPNSTESYLSVKVDEVNLPDDIKAVVRYQLYMDGTEISSTGWSEFKIPKPVTYDEGAYTFSIRTVSDDNGSGERVVLSSTKAVSFKVYELATPRDIELNDDGSISWSMPDPENNVLKVKDGNDYKKEYNSILDGYVVMMGGIPIPAGRDANKVYFADQLYPGTFAVNVYAKSKMESKMVNGVRQPIKLSFGKDENGNPIVAEINNEKATVGTGDIVLSSGYSTTREISQLSAPTQLSIDDNILSWTGVEGCIGYNIYYAAANKDGASFYGLTKEPINSTNFKLDELDSRYVTADVERGFNSMIQEGGCVINVVAVGNKGRELRNGEKYSFDSTQSVNKEIFKHAAPTNLMITDTGLDWNPVPNVSSYEVYDFGARLMIVDGNSVTMARLNLRSGEHELSVVAVGDGQKYFNSEKSEVLKVYRLNEMTISRKGDSYVWAALPYVIHYQLIIDNKPYSVDADPDAEAAFAQAYPGETYYYSYKPTFDLDGTVKVEYRALANNGMKNDDFGGYVIASKSNSFSQKVTKKAAPIFKQGAATNFTLDSNYGSITITANVETAPEGYTYKYRVDTIDYYSETPSFKYNEGKVQPGEYNIEIAYGANFFGTDDVYYLDTDYANYVAKVTFLRETYNISATGTDGTYLIKWDSIKKAAGYRAYYEIYENTIERKAGEMLFASKLETYGSDTISFEVDLRKDLGLEANDPINYRIRVYIVTYGNETDSVSFYDIAQQDEPEGIELRI